MTILEFFLILSIAQALANIALGAFAWWLLAAYMNERRIYRAHCDGEKQKE